MNENTISSKLNRINNAVDRMRTKTGLVSGVIEDVATAVEGMSVINNQDKEITANGTYSAEEGYTGLGTINVNVPTGGTPVKSNVYRVPTIEARDAITDMVEGDLCVVHSSNISNATVDSRFRTATFPDTVVLDTAVTDYVDVRYRAVDESVMLDCNGNLDSSSFSMSVYYPKTSEEIRIQYTSSDGLTYTRTDTTGNPIDFGTEIYYEMPEYWNDAIGHFMQVSSTSFEGMFEYKDSSWNYARININTTPEYIYIGKKAYTNNGEIIGTITENPSTELDDINSKIYAELLKKYNNMNYIVAPEDATEYFANKKLYTIPVKIDGTPLLDTSNTTNMRKMFSVCSSLISIPKLDTSKVTNMQEMFNACTSLTSIPQLDTSKVTTMSGMFGDCWELTSIPQLDTSNVTNMYDMFNRCWGLTSIPQLNTINVTSMSYTFSYCKKITTIPLLDTSNVTTMNSMFSACESLTAIPQLDTSKVTSMTDMFSSCTSLASIPQLDTSNVTNMGGMLGGCTSLTTIPLLNTSKVTNMRNMFIGCTSLTSIPQLDTSKVTEMWGMFERCTSLTTIPLLNTSNVTSFNYMFRDCPNLTDESLNNILIMAKNSKVVPYNVSGIGLNADQKERIKSLPAYNDFIAAGWTNS